MHRLNSSQSLRSGLSRCLERSPCASHLRCQSSSAKTQISPGHSSRPSKPADAENQGSSRYQRDEPRKPSLLRDSFDWKARKMSKKAVQDLDYATYSIGSKQANPPPAWPSKKGHGLRGDEMALKAMLPTVKKPRVSSLEKQKFTASEELADEEEETGLSPCPKGSFVEVRRNEMQRHGIVLGDVYIDRRWHVRILTANGEMWEPYREDIVFTIPSLIPIDVAERCGQETFSVNPVQLNARVEALRRLRIIEKDIQNAYNAVCQKDIDIYSIVRSKSPTTWTTVTVGEIAGLLVMKPKVIDILATHKYLMSRPIHFVASPNYEVSQTFEVRPEYDVTLIETVMTWARARESPIDTFAPKAREIIAKNKEHYTKARDGPPSAAPADHSWTQDEKIIIDFLIHALRPSRSLQEDPFTIAQSAIMRRLFPDIVMLHDDNLYDTLVDLGVLAPWQDLVTLRSNLNLDLSGSEMREQDELVQRAVSSPPAKGTLGPEDFYPSDPLESVRHDFGDMPVYVVDDIGAQELDDGISIERIPTDPSCVWLHTHVADPASLIPPTHALAQAARRRSQTAYFLHRTFPMLPKSLMHHPELGLSLGSGDSANGQRVLTFSAKVNKEGNLLDHKIRAGRVRKVHVLSYDAVDMAVRGGTVPRDYPFGGKPEPLRYPTLTESQVQDLRDMQSYADSAAAKRFREGIINPSKAYPHFSKLDIPDDIESPTMSPTYFSGFPSYTLSVSQIENEDTGARQMVAEMMKLASRVTSLTLLEHGLPAIRRGAAPTLFRSEEDRQKLLAMRTPQGYVQYEDMLPLIEHMPAATYTLEPAAHFGLAIKEGEGYVRATSPLRRFSDFIVHWQIHHMLSGAPNSATPFDKAFLSKYMMELFAKDRKWRRAEDDHILFWMVLFLKKWREDTARGVKRDWLLTPDPLENLVAQTMESPKWVMGRTSYSAKATIPALGMRVNLVDIEDFRLPVGTRMHVKISDIKIGSSPIVLVVQR